MDLVEKYPPVDTFEEAIQLMDNYSWRELHLVAVHPEYAEFIQFEMKNSHKLNRRKFMNPHGPSTSAVAESITEELNKKGYDVYYDHGQASKFVGKIAVSIEKKLGREKEISQMDIAVIERNLSGERNLRRVIALIEIEETTDNPKKLIGDIFAVLLGTSAFLLGGEQVDVGEWTTLIIIGKGADHKYRDDKICEMALKARFTLATNNSNIGNIVIKSFSEDKPLKNLLVRQIKKAIQRI